MSGLPPTRQPPSRRTLIIIVTPLVLLTIGAYVGDAMMPVLVDSNPRLLIALNARNRNLALVTNDLDALSYYAIGTIRLLLSDPLFYLLGWLYGDAAVKWAERNTNTLGNTLRWVERRFKNWAIPLVFAFPNNFICLFAGAARMSPAVFIVANVSGTVIRLYIIRALGEVFSGPLSAIVDFIARYRMPLLALSIALVIFTIASERRRGGGELTGLARLSDGIDADMNEDTARDQEASDEIGASADLEALDEVDEPDDAPETRS